MADYLKHYAEVLDLPIRLHSRVVKLKGQGTGYLVQTDTALFEAEQVVVATGPFQQPFVPDIRRDLAEEVGSAS